MKCPDCTNSPLEKVTSRQGVEVDYCQRCHGVWLDRGEIYLLARRGQTCSRRLKEADKKDREPKYSPKTNKLMNLLNYPEGSEVYICDSGGIWIDGSQIMKYNQGSEEKLNLSIILGCEKQLSAKQEPAADSVNKKNCHRGSAALSWINIPKNIFLMLLLSLGTLIVCIFLGHYW